MSSAHNIIEINGHAYDTVTGKRLSASVPFKHQAKHPITAPIRPSGHNVDGIVSHRPPAAQHHSKPVHRPAVTHTPVPPKKLSRTPHTAAAVHHKTQPAHTLMRHVVKRPAPKARIGSVTASNDPYASTTTLEPTPTLVPRGDSVRQKHASHTAKNHLVSRFNADIFRPGNYEKREQEVAVRPVPEAQPETQQVKVPASPQPAHHQAHQAAHHTVSAEELFHNALKHASAHTESQPAAPRKKPSRHRKHAKKAGLGAAFASVLLLVAFVGYQNVPNLSMRYAAARAGIDASLPATTPSGFSFAGPVQYGSGFVTVSFKSHSDSRAYYVSQRESQWNSEALLANFITPKGKPYQTYQDKGKTIYIYDGSNATWVDGGTWYQIEGETSELNSNQLISIAASM